MLSYLQQQEKMEQDCENPNLVTLIMDKPSRPLNSYNLFFRFHRDRILNGASQDDYTSFDDAIISVDDVANINTSKRYENGIRRNHRKTHGKVGFTELSKIISHRWKTSDAETRQLFEDRAAQEKRLYDQSMKKWLKKMQDVKKQLQEQRQQQQQMAQEKTLDNDIANALMLVDNEPKKPEVQQQFDQFDDEPVVENLAPPALYNSGMDRPADEEIWMSNARQQHQNYHDYYFHDVQQPEQSSFSVDLFDDMTNNNYSDEYATMTNPRPPAFQHHHHPRMHHRGETTPVLRASNYDNCSWGSSPRSIVHWNDVTRVNTAPVHNALDDYTNTKITSSRNSMLMRAPCRRTVSHDDVDVSNDPSSHANKQRLILVRHGRVINESELIKFNLESIRGNYAMSHPQKQQQPNRLLSSPEQHQQMMAPSAIQRCVSQRQRSLEMSSF